MSVVKPRSADVHRDSIAYCYQDGDSYHRRPYWLVHADLIICTFIDEPGTVIEALEKKLIDKQNKQGIYRWEDGTQLEINQQYIERRVGLEDQREASKIPIIGRYPVTLGLENGETAFSEVMDRATSHIQFLGNTIATLADVSNPLKEYAPPVPRNGFTRYMPPS